MSQEFLLYTLLYLSLGIFWVLFIFNFPLIYLDQFKRSVFILKTVSFKLKAKQDPKWDQNKKQEYLNSLKKEQGSYIQEAEEKIEQETQKQLSPNYQTTSILIVIFSWPLILVFFMTSEFLRLVYLNKDDLS